MTIFAAGAAPPTLAPASAGRRGEAAASGFGIPAGLDGAEVSTAREAAAGAFVHRAGAILALQEERSGAAGAALEANDREARRRAREMLDALAELQQGLLGGGFEAARLRRLAELADAELPECDPRLAGLLASVRLRAKLEVLRQRRAGGAALPGI